MRNLLQKNGPLLAAVLLTATTANAQPSSPSRSATPLAQQALTSQTKLSDIRALPVDTPVRLPNGHVVPARQVIKLSDAIIRIQQGGSGTKQGSPNPQYAFSRTQAPVRLQLKPGVNLREVAKRPDSDVLQLPNGQKLTVGDMKKVAAVEKLLSGRSLLDAPAVASAKVAPPTRQGPAIRIASREDLSRLAGKPDATVLESPKGKRITLGELRAYAKLNGKPLGERK